MEIFFVCQSFFILSLEPIDYSLELFSLLVLFLDCLTLVIVCLIDNLFPLSFVPLFIRPSFFIIFLLHLFSNILLFLFLDFVEILLFFAFILMLLYHLSFLLRILLLKLFSVCLSLMIFFLLIFNHLIFFLLPLILLFFPLLLMFPDHLACFFSIL